MKIKLRKFTHKGANHFKEELNKKKKDFNYEISKNIISDSEFTKEICENEIELKTIKDKKELAKYLLDIIPIKFYGDFDMWNWLSCFYLDLLVSNKIGSINRYFCSKNSSVYSSDPFRRHQIAMPVLFYKAHEKSNNAIDIILKNSPLHTYGEMIEQSTATQDYYNCTSVFDCMYSLYWDKTNNSIKRGAASHVRRLIKVLGQLSINYDFYDMKGSDIIDILPDEFNDWKLV